MNALSLNLPKSLHGQLVDLARDEGVSVDQFVMLAVAEKIASISTIEYLKKREKSGNRARFFEILNNAPDVEPEDFDKL